MFGILNLRFTLPSQTPARQPSTIHPGAPCNCWLLLFPRVHSVSAQVTVAEKNCLLL